MPAILRNITAAAALAFAAFAALYPAEAAAQDRSASSGVQRRSSSDAPGRRASDRGKAATPGVTQRMQNAMESAGVTDADMDWQRVLYREIDLTKDANAPLYYPDEVIDGKKNLFRIVMDHVAAGDLPVYEYLDGREIFSDQYKVAVRDMLDRFHILYAEAKGSTAKHPKFDIDESDVPANEVLSFYVIERWEADRRSNRLRCIIEAVCPVLHRSGDFGGEAVRYPMFWVKYDDLKPFLSGSSIFLSDDNNLATHSIDDFFTLNLYDGEIYKTRNLRNLSLAQQYSDPDRRRQVQDSIQASLDNWGKKMWVPSLAELEAMRVAREEAAERAERGEDVVEVASDLSLEGDSLAAVQEPVKKVNSRVNSRANSRTASKSAAKKKPTKKKSTVKKAKAPKSSSSASSSATRSVRNRRK